MNEKPRSDRSSCMDETPKVENNPIDFADSVGGQNSGDVAEASVDKGHAVGVISETFSSDLERRFVAVDADHSKSRIVIEQEQAVAACPRGSIDPNGVRAGVGEFDDSCAKNRLMWELCHLKCAKSRPRKMGVRQSTGSGQSAHGSICRSEPDWGKFSSMFPRVSYPVTIVV